MVSFGSGYYMPMDREFSSDHSHHHSHGEDHMAPKSTGDVGVQIGDLGMSLGLGPVPNVHAIAAKLRPGTKKLEFVFTGMGKGSGQGQTPGMYGAKQRQALVEMGKANNVDFTTHSTVGVYGLSGMDQQGNFSKVSKNASLQEVKRAIQFASDVGRGGPVVVHTGEFNRPITDASWNHKKDQWAGKFKLYSDEDEMASYRVVDTRTGGVIQEARKNRKVSRPVWNVAVDGTEYVDLDGNKKVARGREDAGGQPIYMDYFGNRVKPEDRIPEYDSENQKFVIHQMDWDDLRKEASEMTLRAKQLWSDWKKGKISDEEYKESRWVRFNDVHSADEIHVRPEEAYIISTLETNAANSRGWAIYYGGSFDKTVDKIKKLQKAKELYLRIENTSNEEEKLNLMRQVPSDVGDLVPADSKLPSEIIDEVLRRHEQTLKQSQEASASQWTQAEESFETIRHVESAETYAVKEAWDAYADLGINAMRESNKLKKLGKMQKPLAVAMENLFPEHYGSHPDELIVLVKGARSRMEKKLVQLGMNEEQAKKEANEHLTATFDTGHLNMWRKYWQGDPKKSLAENDELFNKWSLEKVKDMTDAGIVGHVHIDDNYGYHDDHLAPGEGNAPIRAMIKLLKEEGYDGELIIEPGADYTTDASGFHSVMKTWKDFGLNVYGTGSGVGGGKGRPWGQIQYNHFGANQPPYFVFGAYSPSEDFTLWSGVPLE